MSMTSEYAIDLGDVTKVYKRKVHALRGIDMRVHRGEIFGLLGPNGAGKSTLVKILMTIISPTKAVGSMLGQPLGHKPTLGRVGYLPEHHRFPDYLTGAQVVDFYGAMCCVPREERRRRTAELLEFVGMAGWANEKVKGYSKGMRQRIGLAQALVNKPALVVLDEPTDGVDPVGRREIRTMLQKLRDTGVTVFLNSHLLSELEMVCDRVAILVQGQVKSQGTIDELTRDQRAYELELEVGSTRAARGENESAPALPASAHDGAEAIFRGVLPGVFLEPARRPVGGGAASGVAGRGGLTRWGDFEGRLATGERVMLEGATLKVETDDPKVMQPIIDAVRQRGGVIKSLRARRPSLEDLFMQAVIDPNSGQVLAPGAKDMKSGSVPHGAPAAKPGQTTDTGGTPRKDDRP